MSSSVGWLIALVGLFLLPLAHVQPSAARQRQFFALFLLHLVATVAYAQYALANPADANLYYGDPYGWSDIDFQFGTIALLKVTQDVKSLIDGTFLDVFLVFQITGFIGLVFMARTIEEIYLEVGLPQSRFSYLIVFLPSLMFWTVAIGKDAPLFMACSIAVWGMRDPGRRLPALLLAVVPMVLFRPHIALVTIIALVGSSLFDRRTSTAVKVLLALLILAGLGALIEAVQTALRVDVTSLDSLTDFVSSKQAAADSDASNLPYILRLFSLLFRPFFVDATGVLGLVASFENVVMVVMIGTLVGNARLVTRICLGSAATRFAMIFAGLLIVLLALLYYNVGLGLRERAMMMPALIAAFVATMAVRARASATHVSPAII